MKAWRKYAISQVISPWELRKLMRKSDIFRERKLRQRAWIKVKVGSLGLKHSRLQNELAYSKRSVIV